MNEWKLVQNPSCLHYLGLHAYRKDSEDGLLRHLQALWVRVAELVEKHGLGCAQFCNSSIWVCVGKLARGGPVVVRFPASDGRPVIVVDSIGLFFGDYFEPPTDPTLRAEWVRLTCHLAQHLMNAVKEPSVQARVRVIPLRGADLLLAQVPTRECFRYEPSTGEWTATDERPENFDAFFTP